MDRGALARLASEEILGGLYGALKAEQRAVVDYDAHARSAESAGLRVALESLRDVEREHARRLERRIIDLGGTPAEEPAGPPSGGSSIEEWLADDLRGEQWAIVEYARLVAGILDDHETAGLMAELLFDEIRHARWLKATLRGLEPAES